MLFIDLEDPFFLPVRSTQCSCHSFEWTIVHKSVDIHVVFCFLLQSSGELRGSSVHSGEHHTGFLHCWHHAFGLDEQESNSRVEGTILPASIQRSAILVMFKIQWFRACWLRSSRSRPNDWTLHCMLQLGTFPNHSGKSRNVSIIWF